MKSKIRVHGKSQSRTALGIINAYLKLHPYSTPADVQRAFPKTLNSKCGADNLIIPVEETLGYEKLFFEQEDEQIIFKSGERFALVEIWAKDDFIAICRHAKQYGIEVAEEGTRPFEKGSFELEYLDETNKIDEVKKKGKFHWWWILLLLLLLLVIILCCWKCCSSEHKRTGAVENVTPVEIVVEAIPDTTEEDKDEQPDSPNSLIVDNGSSISITLPDGNVLNIAKDSPEFKLFSFLNSPDSKVETDQTQGWITLDKIGFEKGKTNLAPESENQLKNVARIMQFFPNSRIKAGGHTDNTGTDAVNMRVSNARAKVAAGKIISSGVEANRVSHEGYGSQRPLCPPNDSEDCRAANRRVDIKVIQK